MAALCFLTSLPRPEVVTILEERALRLEETYGELQCTEEHTAVDPEKPPHSVEFVKLGSQQVQGELVFTRSPLDRIHAGSYAFLYDAAEGV